MARFGLFHIWGTGNVGFVIANEVDDGYVMSVYGILDVLNGIVGYPFLGLV